MLCAYVKSGACMRYILTLLDPQTLKLKHTWVLKVKMKHACCVQQMNMEYSLNDMKKMLGEHGTCMIEVKIDSTYSPLTTKFIYM